MCAGAWLFTFRILKCYADYLIHCVRTYHLLAASLLPVSNIVHRIQILVRSEMHSSLFPPDRRWTTTRRAVCIGICHACHRDWLPPGLRLPGRLRLFLVSLPYTSAIKGCALLMADRDKFDRRILSAPASPPDFPLPEFRKHTLTSFVFQASHQDLRCIHSYVPRFLIKHI